MPAEKCMMKRAVSLFLCAAVCAGACAFAAGCGEKKTGGGDGYVQSESIDLFPKPDEGYAGDPIPFYDGENLNVYYIHDARSWNDGYFHPWNLFRTNNFYEWEDMGRVIAGNYNDKANQDYGIGTGTVLEGHDGKYHAFYTGWNGYPQADVEFTEKVQHAVSDDLIHWTKIPEDGFYGGVDDFRDPHVVWVPEDNCYWMLVSTWRGFGDYTAVLKWYKSEDLSDWEYAGIFYDDAVNGDFMECPTLMQYNGYWYLSYFQKAVDGTNARVTRYVYKKDLSDPEWIRPEVDYFDGAGLSAARLVACGDKLVTVGWIGTKISDWDEGLFTWAGNLAVHELRQRSDGSLYVVPVEGVLGALSHETGYAPAYTGDAVTYKDGNISFGESDRFQYLLFEEMRGEALKTQFTLSSEGGKAGLTFARGDTGYGEVCIEFDFEEGLISFFNTKPTLTDPLFSDVASQAVVALPAAKDGKYACTMLSQGECLTLYVNDEIALSTRIYDLTGYGFGFYAAGQKAEVSALKFYH